MSQIGFTTHLYNFRNACATNTKGKVYLLIWWKMILHRVLCFGETQNEQFEWSGLIHKLFTTHNLCLIVVISHIVIHCIVSVTFSSEYGVTTSLVDYKPNAIIIIWLLPTVLRYGPQIDELWFFLFFIDILFIDFICFWMRKTLKYSKLHNVFCVWVIFFRCAVEFHPHIY